MVVLFNFLDGRGSACCGPAVVERASIIESDPLRGSCMFFVDLVDSVERICVLGVMDLGAGFARGGIFNSVVE